MLYQASVVTGTTACLPQVSERTTESPRKAAGVGGSRSGEMKVANLDGWVEGEQERKKEKAKAEQE